MQLLGALFCRRCVQNRRSCSIRMASGGWTAHHFLSFGLIWTLFNGSQHWSPQQMLLDTVKDDCELHRFAVLPPPRDTYAAPLSQPDADLHRLGSPKRKRFCSGRPGGGGVQ